MSRFFRGSDSESESSSSNSSSSSSSEYSSDEESSQNEISEEEQSSSDYSDSESEDEDVKRVVRSAKDKRFEEMRTCVNKIESARRTNNWVLLATEFDKLTKTVTKSQNVIKQTGIPSFFTRALVSIEDFLKESQDDKEARKKMNASNAKAMTAMKQKIRKHNKQYERDIEAFRANPVSSAESAGSDAEAEDEEEPKEKKKKKKGSAAVRALEAEEGDEDNDGFTTVGKGGKAVVYTTENLFKKLREVIIARGKKGTDRSEQIGVLRELLKVAATPFQQIRVLLVLISTQFDYTPGVAGYMNVDIWKSTEREISQLLGILEANPQYIVKEDATDALDDEAEANEIRGSIVTFIERLDDEFTRALQNIDPHTTDYVDRLKDENALYAVIVRTQIYLTSKDLVSSLCRVMSRRLEHIYFKPDQVAAIAEKAAITLLPKQAASEMIVYEDADIPRLVSELSTFLYKNAPPFLRTRALLCHIFHHALGGRFYKARDLLLLSHLQDNITQADINTQVLYNRTLVQIGLCAFRLGMIKEAEVCLQDICASGRLKELLAQGVQYQRNAVANPEKEKLERQRQLPFHMHINLELIECVYLTCAMLTEIPNMAKAGSLPEARKRINSKPFRRLLDYSDRLAFVGPPENTRDHIVAASKALLSGEWQQCQTLIKDIKIWELMPDQEKIKTILVERIQEDALRTHLFANGAYISTIYLKDLAVMFDLSDSKVQRLVARMIFEEGLQASLDQPNNLLVMQCVEPTALQALALALADKVVMMADDNERALDVKLGSDRQGGQREGARDNQRNPRNAAGGGGGGGGNARGGNRTGNRNPRGGGGNRNNRGGHQNRPRRQQQQEGAE
ncbi:eukaryotic translation initiation factor 3 subunit 8 N-terminus-domain-containing protein [Syncephalis fuscata]|nr:eukaryotic translation initiation factor 3 subunit 8 N-terminus-domain-containing protein [Syncephalis fuscata]